MGSTLHLLTTYAQGRKKSVAEMRTLIDHGPYTARQAAGKGLIDSLRYEDQVYGELKDQLKQGELKKVSFQDYVRAIGTRSRREEADRVRRRGRRNRTRAR